MIGIVRITTYCTAVCCPVLRVHVAAGEDSARQGQSARVCAAGHVYCSAQTVHEYVCVYVHVHLVLPLCGTSCSLVVLNTSVIFSPCELALWMHAS